jgi:hypothetical protein
VADGFLIGSGYIQVTPDTTGFKGDLDSRLAEENTSVKVPVTPDTGDFQAKLKAAVDKAQVTADVKVKVDSSGGGGFDQVRKEASDAGGESGGLFENQFVQNAFGGKKTALITAAGVGLSALPALAGVQGVMMGTELITEMTMAVLEQNKGLQKSLTSVGQGMMATLQQAIQPLVPVIENAARQVSGLLKQIEPQLQSLFTSLIPVIGQVLPAVEGLAAPVLGFFRAVVPAMAPLITGLLGLVKDILPGLSALVRATAPEMSSFGGILAALGKNLGSMLADFGKAIGPSMTVLGALLGVVGGLLPVIAKLAGVFADALAPVLVSFGKAITGLMPVITTMGSTLGAFAGAVLTSLSEALSAVGQVVTALAPSFRVLAAAMTQAFTVWENTGVFNDLEDSFEELAKPLAAIISALVGGLAPILPVVMGFIAQFADVIQGALVQAVTALAPPLTQLITVTLASLVQILPAILPLITEFAAILAGGLADVIAGIATGLTAVMNALGPAALGAAIVAVAAVVGGLKAWAAIQAALEGEGFVAMIAGWVAGIGTFVAATEGATIAQKALLVAETAADALDPFAWVAVGAVALAGLAAVIMNTTTSTRSYVETLQEADNATGYNIAGYDKLGEQLNATATSQQKLNTVTGQAAGATYAAYSGTNLYAGAQQQLETESSQAFATASKLNDAMNTLGTTYGISEKAAIGVAQAAGIQATAWTNGGAALDKANAKFAAYIINNQDALAPQQEVNALMSIFGSSATNAATQTNALNTAWQILVGNFVDKQQAMLNASTAVQQYAVSAKSASGNTQQLQLQFYSTIQQLQPLIDQISKTHGPMGTLYNDLQNQIHSLQTSGPLNAAEQQALARLQTLADALANSTHGMTTAQQQAATSLESSLIPQLTDLGVKSTTAQTDTKNLTDAILNTGTTSAATSADRAQLIKDLEASGVNAQTATGLVDAYIKKIGAIPAGESTKISVSGSGQWSVAESQVGLPSGPKPVSSALGRLVTGGIPGKDSVLLNAMPGELIVPEPMVHAGLVDHLRGMIPGFADGGIVGSPPSIGQYADSQFAATNQSVVQTTEQAMVTAINAAIAAAKAAAVPKGGSDPAKLAQIESWWTGAGGPGGSTAHIAAAITGAESGFNVAAIQQGQPYATTGWGLWQITPGDSEPQAGIDNALLTGPSNAIAAVAKYHGSGGFSPWTTYESGAYEQFMDNGGYLMPGRTVVRNDTGQPERVVSPSQEKAAAAARPAPVINNTFAYYGPQQPTPEMQQAMLINLASMVGAAG